MNKNDTRLYVGLGGQEQVYVINGVTYFVGSNFQKPNFKNDTSIRDRFERLTVNEPIPLQVAEIPDTIAEEYVCSTVGKEDN